MENSIIQELNAEADKIIGNTLLPAKYRQRYEQVYKLFIELPHFVTQFVHETLEVRFVIFGGLPELSRVRQSRSLTLVS